MPNEIRVPWNAKEGLIYMLIVSIISVNTIAPLIMGFEMGFSKTNYLKTLQILPLMWIIVLCLVNFVAKPLVGKLMAKFTKPTDCFNAKTLFNIFFSVAVLSICLTVIGSWVGQRHISLDPIQGFFHHWPKNFCIAFWIEMLIAQPIARFVMKKIHVKQVAKAAKMEKVEA
ncbi:hypothetical protein [Paenibacillus barengoltzii]|uniref:DUF2798 domain-containing protein n=1 Tax=Paenibacillus barengoltzii G22 TaxID=1235795 RepID=R9LF28_9BACL|nr:hypothetical protein [Paenibacillus barengoltzii]EOS57310.1 hypothetical protein C812_01630 [Paenibacillus barengoltzii G22]